MLTCNITFDIADEIHKLGITGSYFIIQGLQNKENDVEFLQLRQAVLQTILPNLSKEEIVNDPILQGFRLLHDKVNRSNKKNVASPENLLLMLAEQRPIPNINLLVDIYNLVSLETRLAIGAHDLKKIAGNIHLRLTDGTEGFHALGYAAPQSVGPGEYAYIDDANDIICRLEVRQVEKTKITLETTDCFFIVQGNSATSDQYVSDAAQRLIQLVKQFCGGSERLLQT